MPRCLETKGGGSSVAAYTHMELSSSDCCCLQMIYNAPAHSKLLAHPVAFCVVHLARNPTCTPLLLSLCLVQYGVPPAARALAG